MKVPVDAMMLIILSSLMRHRFVRVCVCGSCTFLMGKSGDTKGHPELVCGKRSLDGEDDERALRKSLRATASVSLRPGSASRHRFQRLTTELFDWSADQA